MNSFQVIVLGLLQGATEFIPVSSSGHLVLVPWALGWPEPGLAFNVTVHWGTLVAVIVYFRHDLILLAGAWLRGLRTRSWVESQARLPWLLLLGSLPAAAMGLFFEQLFETLFNTPVAVAGLLVVTGMLLLVSEWLSRRKIEARQLYWLDAMFIGIGQAMAIAPGISRSGTTISAGLLRGLPREQAARFSFLLAIPVIFGAGVLQLEDLVMSGVADSAWYALTLGFLAAAASGYICIHVLLGYVRRRSLCPFALYCCLFGSVVLVLTQATPSSPTFESPPTPGNLVLRCPETLYSLIWDLRQAYQSLEPNLSIIVTGEDTNNPDLIITYDEATEGYRVPFALDALVIIVHPHSKVTELTLLQVQDIFSGRTNTWSPLGGDQTEIRVLDQTDNTASHHFFTLQVMKSQTTTPNALLVPNDSAAVDQVALDPSAVSYISLGSLSSQVRPVAIEGASPIPENLAGGVYHLLRPAYLMSTNQPTGKVQRFIEFVFSDEGQAIIAQRYGRVEIVRRYEERQP